MMTNNTPSAKPNYGIDAPNVIRNIFIVSIISFLIAFLAPTIHVSLIKLKPETFMSIAVSFLIPGSLMLLYSLIGKYKYRDYLLSQFNWQGNETVLDVGTGKGLLMIGAAKKLDIGQSYGIDIWNKEDLTGNSERNARMNAHVEGVADKVQIRNQDVTKMTFDNAFFDVIISNLCLHNIHNKLDRKKACAEIQRVLKPGGVIIIADFKHSSEYKAAFKELGMRIDLVETAYLTTFPPLTMIKATKAFLP